MPNEFSDPRSACAILLGCAQLAIVGSGLAFMLSLRRAASRLFLVGLFLAVAAGLSQTSGFAENRKMILPDWIGVWLAVVGGCLLIFGARGAGFVLVLPALLRFVLFPNLAPALSELAITPFLIVLPLVMVFGGIFLLQFIVRPIYGESAGGYVAGNYLVRVFDRLGRGIIVVLSLLFRVLRRRDR